MLKVCNCRKINKNNFQLNINCLIKNVVYKEKVESKNKIEFKSTKKRVVLKICKPFIYIT